MGDIAHRSARRSVAVIVVAALAVAAVAVAVLRPSEQERFRSWLLDQPGVVSVGEPDRALAVGTVAARAYEPTLHAAVRDPLSVDLVGRLGRGVVAYAARHPAVAGSSVELRQGGDAVLVSTEARHNATTTAVLAAMRDLPGLVSVGITVAPSGRGTLGAVVRSGTDLPASVTSLARAVPDPTERWVTGSSPVVVRDDGTGHEVRSEEGAVPTENAARAFDLAVREDPDHPVALVVRGSGLGARTIIELRTSPRLSRTAAALHGVGFGLRARHEVVTGPEGELPMDERGWADRLAETLSGASGVRAAHVDPGGDDAGGPVGVRPVLADLRVDPDVALAPLFRALPTTVEQVEVHTAPGAPDYDRDDALAPDPEVDCPAGDGGLNLAYSGPRNLLPKASNYLSALRPATVGATCVHWAEATPHGRPTAQTLLVRLPLEEQSWRPVLDVVRARRADLGSAHPALILLMPVPGRSWTAVFNLAEGEAPFVTALGTERPGDGKDVEALLDPLVRYWTRG